MTWTGKYLMTVAQADYTLYVRPYYDNTLHITLADAADNYGPVDKIEAGETVLSFSKGKSQWKLCAKADGTFSGERTLEGVTESFSCTRAEITAADDKSGLIQMKKRALVMYATITHNTEKIANCFKTAFEHYGMAVDMIKLTGRDAGKPPRGYNDYDIVCLGSPIIAGSPMAGVIKQFSLGGGTSLEANVTKNAEAGVHFNTGGVGLRGPGDSNSPDRPGGADGHEDPGGSGGPGHIPEMDDGQLHYAGGPAPHGVYHPLGLVFTTYGGGFYGSNEALATLELLRLYLELKSVSVVGKFACCGREYGPAGLADGELPNTMGSTKAQAPVYYMDADGNYHAGSFFFHTHMNSKPNARDLMKATSLAMDIIEDYFFSHDGIRKDVASQYISIS